MLIAGKGSTLSLEILPLSSRELICAGAILRPTARPECTRSVSFRFNFAPRSDSSFKDVLLVLLLLLDADEARSPRVCAEALPLVPTFFPPVVAGRPVVLFLFLSKCDTSFCVSLRLSASLEILFLIASCSRLRSLSASWSSYNARNNAQREHIQVMNETKNKKKWGCSARRESL